MEKKKLEFYGGEWVSVLPFVIFLVLIILTTFFWQSISDGALWVPAFVALLLPFFLAKDKKVYADTIIEGMSSKDAITPVVCWIFAGVFSRILRMSGLANGIAGICASFGLGPTAFAVVTFLLVQSYQELLSVTTLLLFPTQPSYPLHLRALTFPAL